MVTIMSLFSIFKAKYSISDMNMIRNIFALDTLVAMWWNRYTPMITAKFNSPQQSLHEETQTEHRPVSSRTVDTGYQRVELLLIGFASVFITFLWVGVFSAVLKDQSVRVPFAGSSRAAAVTRNAADYISVTGAGMMEAGGIVKDSVAYQFTVIWETSCLTQMNCTPGLQRFSEDGSDVVAATVTRAGLLVAIVDDLRGFRIAEAGAELAAVVAPQKSYAADVLGERTVSTDEIIRKGSRAYYRYVDSLTFGAITAINSELLSEEVAHR